MLDFRAFHAEKPTWHFLFRLILRIYKCVRVCVICVDTLCGGDSVVK